MRAAQPHCQRQKTDDDVKFSRQQRHREFFISAMVLACQIAAAVVFIAIAIAILVSLTKQGKSFGEAVGILFGIVVGVGSFLWCVKWFCTYKVGSSDDDTVAEVPVSNAPTVSVTAHRQTFTHTLTNGTTTHTHTLSHTHTVTEIV